MRQLVISTFATLALVACGGGQPAEAPSAEGGPEPVENDAAPEPETSGSAATEPGASQANTFALKDSDTAKDARGATESKIKPTKTEAAMKFIVVDKDKGPIQGLVVSLSAAGKTYYTAETDETGYAEVLVPVGQKYDLVYLSLGGKDVAASVPVSNEPNQNIKLTLRYKGYEKEKEPRFVLSGVEFDTGKATIRPESFPRLDSVVEYMLHKKSAKIEISGHTDNKGNAKTNKTLSEKRAQACRDYLISKGIDGSRIQAIGYGDERPIAPNTTEEGRQQNRRIEAAEL
ncbi:MAG TPA: OmpA family protein [Polyangiaceae bacterium]|nr:OmpA family protein [Polyangiaceae bacterium]